MVVVRPNHRQVKPVAAQGWDLPFHCPDNLPALNSGPAQVGAQPAAAGKGRLYRQSKGDGIALETQLPGAGGWILSRLEVNSIIHLILFPAECGSWRRLGTRSLPLSN